MGSEYIKLAQLGHDGKSLSVVAGGKQEKPADIEVGTSQWQHWAIKAVKQMVAQGTFKNKKVVTALPADEVYIDQVRIAKVADDQLRQAVIAKVESKLPFDSDNALVQFVVTNPGAESDVLVMATERTKVDRHLAIYEQANLQIQAISIWPLAMISSYITFFGRRAEDVESTVMLLEMGANYAKVVICRHKHLLFARLVPIGIRQIQNQEMVKRLIFEISASMRHFESTIRNTRLDRLIFFTSQATDKTLCENIVQLAQHLRVPAQIGDVLAAVRIGTDEDRSVERRNCNLNWTAAFGLSLSSEGK